jgi:hypothetical protein
LTDRPIPPEEDITRLTGHRFPQVILDEERVVARGEVSALRQVQGESLANRKVWLEHAERGILLEGTAVVVLDALVALTQA